MGRRATGTEARKTLRRGSGRTAKALRPIDLARTVGMGVTQVRTYERLGFIPAAERGPNGYRRYTDEHVSALRVARTVIGGYGWAYALEVMRAAHAGDRSTVLALMDARHAGLDRQRSSIRSMLERIDAMLRGAGEGGGGGGEAGIRGGARSGRRRGERARIDEVARAAGVRPSAVRFWERQGLLAPEREPSTGYRLYDRGQSTRVQMIALLRRAGYRSDAIRETLDEFADGRPDQIRRALEERLRSLDENSLRCARATAELHAFLTRSKSGGGSSACTKSGYLLDFEHEFDGGPSRVGEVVPA